MADEITSTENFGSSSNPRRKNAAVITEGIRRRNTVDDTDTDPKTPADEAVDAITYHVAALRTVISTLPNSDLLASVLLAVQSVENSLEAIVAGLAAVDTDESDV